jgi:DNA-binding NtrC family response regulator
MTSDTAAQPGSPEDAEAAAERLQILQALQLAHWNRRLAAKLLDISYGSLLAKLRKHGFTPQEADQHS